MWVGGVSKATLRRRRAARAGVAASQLTAHDTPVGTGPELVFRRGCKTRLN